MVHGIAAGVALFDMVAKRPLPASDTDPKFGRVTDDLFAILDRGSRSRRRVRSSRWPADGGGDAAPAA